MGNRVRVRLNDPPTPAEEIVDAIKRALRLAADLKDLKPHKRDDVQITTKFAFAITAQGIEITAAYLCYRAVHLTTFEELQTSNFSVLSGAVDNARRRLFDQLRHLRNGSATS